MGTGSVLVLVLVDDEEVVVVGFGWRKRGFAVTVGRVIEEVAPIVGAGFAIAVETGLGGCKESGLLELARHRVWVVVVDVHVAVLGSAAVLAFVPVVVAVPVVDTDDAEFVRL